jgi:hypothetical protein
MVRTSGMVDVDSKHTYISMVRTSGMVDVDSKLPFSLQKIMLDCADRDAGLV